MATRETPKTDKEWEVIDEMGARRHRSAIASSW